MKWGFKRCNTCQDVTLHFGMINPYAYCFHCDKKGKKFCDFLEEKLGYKLLTYIRKSRDLMNYGVSNN